MFMYKYISRGETLAIIMHGEIYLFWNILAGLTMLD